MVYGNPSQLTSEECVKKSTFWLGPWSGSNAQTYFKHTKTIMHKHLQPTPVICQFYPLRYNGTVNLLLNQ